MCGFELLIIRRVTIELMLHEIMNNVSRGESVFADKVCYDIPLVVERTEPKRQEPVTADSLRPKGLQRLKSSHPEGQSWRTRARE